MAIQLFTRNDMIRHTIRRVAICVSVTIILVAWVMAILAFGNDSLAMVQVGHVTYWAMRIAPPWRRCVPRC